MSLISKLCQSIGLGAIVASSMLPFSSPAKAYDVNDNKITREALDEVTEAVFKLQGEVVFRKQEKILGFLPHPPVKHTKHGSAIAFLCHDQTTYIMTAYHNLVTDDEREPPADKPELKFEAQNYFIVHEGKRYKAEVEAVDKKNDLAIFSVEKELPTYSLFAHEDELKPGDYTMAIGFPFTYNKTITQGRIMSIGTKEKPYDKTITDTQFYPGMSGGALIVFDEGVPKIGGINIEIRMNVAGFPVLGRIGHAVELGNMKSLLCKRKLHVYLLEPELF